VHEEHRHGGEFRRRYLPKKSSSPRKFSLFLHRNRGERGGFCAKGSHPHSRRSSCTKRARRKEERERLPLLILRTFIAFFSSGRSQSKRGRKGSCFHFTPSFAAPRKRERTPEKGKRTPKGDAPVITDRTHLQGRKGPFFLQKKEGYPPSLFEKRRTLE